MRLAWCAMVLAGCSFDSHGVADDVVVPDADPNAPDADPSLIDADPTMPDAECPGGALGFVPANVDVCDVPAANGSYRFLSTGEYEIDTTNNAITDGETLITELAHGLIVQSGTSQQAMVIAAQDLDIDADAVVTVHGSRPLIVIVYGTLTVNGLIDGTASAARGGPGAGINCSTGAGTDGTTQLGNQTIPLPGGSGGGGGAFGTAGGVGAHVSTQTVADPDTAAGAVWASTLSPLVGGCKGGNGGVANAGEVVALGGGGGGALQLVAGTQVLVNGFVSVSGGGGGGAGVGTLQIAGGGAGGGSGGALLIQSPLFTIQGGVLTANGGGGGEGARDTGPGTPGGEGKLDDDNAAPGGSGVAGGNGGDGGFLVNAGDPGLLGTGSATATAGGGGGGGGVGRIAVKATQIDSSGGAISSPQFTQSPLN